MQAILFLSSDIAKSKLIIFDKNSETRIYFGGLKAWNDSLGYFQSKPGYTPLCRTVTYTLVLGVLNTLVYVSILLRLTMIIDRRKSQKLTDYGKFWNLIL